MRLIYTTLLLLPIWANAQQMYICSGFCTDTAAGVAVTSSAMRPITGIGLTMDSAYDNMQLTCSYPNRVTSALVTNESVPSGFENTKENICHTFSL